MSIPCRTKLWRPSAECEALYVQKKVLLDQRMRDNCGRDANDYECCLATFGELPQLHPVKWEFLILCFQHQWPNTLQIESQGVLNHWLIRKAKGFCAFTRLNLMGCGSSSKTHDASAYLYTLWKSRPFNTSVFLSTTSGEAAQSRTWGQVKDLHTRDEYTVGKRIESLHLITLDEEVRDDEGAKSRDFRNSIKVVMIKTGAEGKNVMAGIVGRKNERVVWCVDEFPFMDMGVLDARVNLNTNPFHQFIGLGNAPTEGDPMYIDSTPFGKKYPAGWASVNKDVDKSWPTQKGFCQYFNGADSPNFKVAPGVRSFPFPRIMNENFRRAILQDAGGEDTPMYWKQFYGFPPTVDISDKVFSHKLLENNGVFTQPEWVDGEKKIVAGLDLGFRMDGDPVVIHFGRLGKNTASRKVLGLEPDGIHLVPSQSSTEAFEPQIAKKVVEECRKRDCHDLCLDVTGDGGILLQHIEREAREQSYALSVTPVSFMGSADDRVVIPGEKRTAREMFQNKVAQIWGQGRVCVINKVIFGLGEHSKCKHEMCERKMGSDDKKRMTVEPKREMKKRLRHSPDRADAGMLCCFCGLANGLAGLEVKSAPKPFDPQKIIAPGQRKTMYGGTHRSVYGGR